MKKFLAIPLISLTLLLSPLSYGQELEASLLENLSQEQLEIAKAELAREKVEVKPKVIIAESTKKLPIESDLNNTIDKKYGYNYFSTIPTSISAVGDLPLPNDYKISLNDQFTVILSGSKESVFDLNVYLDGTILFPELGSISVVGETFEDVKIKLKNLIEQSYIGVQIDLSLKNLSAKKITIVGAVQTPGTYLVNPFSTISSSLAYSGGISKIGTLRSIKLVKVNGDIHNFDLYKLLINGDRSDDLTIDSGDVILVGPAKQFIKLEGQVRRPGIYEIRKEETLDDLIKFGLGYTERANKSNINFKVLNIDKSSIQTITTKNLYSSLVDVTSVSVNPYVNKKIANIKVAGAIKEPGFYSITENETLDDLINRLEFIDVYPWLAILEQFDESNLIKSSTLFNLNDPNTFQSIKLLPNSKLFFSNIIDRTFIAEEMTLDLIEDYKLRINHRQGTFSMPVYGKYSVSSFVDLLGLDMSDINNKATYISPLEDISITDNYKNMQFNASKYNTISFRSPINNMINVTISGAVDYPGIYTLQSNSTLEDLYKIIGAFKKDAFLEGIIFTRKSIRERQILSIEKSKNDLNTALLVSKQKGEKIGDISIIRALSESIEPEFLGRIAGDFSPNSATSMNTILLDGDNITVPVIPNYINVLGEVLNPIAFEYSKKLTIRSAIANAGGYQDYADSKKVYVIKSNGIIEKANRSIFVKNVNLEPGDTIIVPRKIITNNPGIDALLPVTKILSDLAFSAAALETLSNTK